MIEMLEIDGVKYDEAFIKALKTQTQILRDNMLKAGHFDFAVSLSHIHAVLNHYQEEVDFEGHNTGFGHPSYDE